MSCNDPTKTKYRIKSFQYEELQEGRQLLFTIEETGRAGEIRKSAREIMENSTWKNDYAKHDIAKIAFAAACEYEAEIKEKN